MIWLHDRAYTEVLVMTNTSTTQYKEGRQMITHLRSGGQFSLYGL